jgi:Protein of unknown function (DUF3147)
MKPRIDLSALSQIKWYEYLNRFLLGGAITVAAGLIAQHFGARLGGLFLAFPAIFPASATLLEKHERQKKRRAGIAHTMRGRLAAALDARGAAMGSIALAAFAMLVWKELAPHDAALVLLTALVLWLALATLLWRLRKLCVHMLRPGKSPERRRPLAR